MPPKTNEEWVKEFADLKAVYFKDGSIRNNVEVLKNWLSILLTEKDKQREEAVAEAVKADRERINQFFAVKADYDTDSDCVIITDKVYHQAFFPDGCGSDGQDGRNRCEDCYKYRTKFGQNILAKLEPNQSELDQPK